MAIDQRSALRKLFTAATGIAEEKIPRELLEQFKEAVSRILTPHASAILLDPEIGLSAATKRAKNVGLLLAYEQTGYDKSVPGRLPRLLNGWSAAALAAAGANGVKTLLYYSPFSAPRINELKKDWVQRVGEECEAEDVPYFLELVAYHDELDEKGREFAGLTLVDMARAEKDQKMKLMIVERLSNSSSMSKSKEAADYLTELLK